MGTPAPSGPASIVSRRTVALLLIAILGPWLAVGLFFFGGREPAVPAPTPHPVPALTAGEGATACAPGPWGQLEYIGILTEPPEQQIIPTFPATDHTLWIFQGYDRDAFATLWRAAGLDAATIATLSRPELWTTEGATTAIRAPKDVVLRLTPQARTVIYTALAAFPDNAAQAEPYRFTLNARDEWFKDSGLKPETIAKIEPLLYSRGNSLLFSDQALVIPDLQSREESTRLLKTLARKSTLMLKLRVDASTDVEALENYWGFPGAKDIVPLLNSLKRRGTSTAVDIVHLLPRFARSRLYSYPAPNDPGVNSYMDCHWTVLNFFNQEPNPRYQDLNEVALTFRSNYHTVTGRPRYGDVYLFTLPNGDVIHSCVYIADNIVFTKNGSAPSSPWLLMKYEDVVAFYPSDQPLDIQRYRPNTLSSY